MKYYTVTGMSCAACASRIEKAVSSVDGVTLCTVSLLTNTLAVEGKADEKTVIKAVTAAGYGAAPVKNADGAFADESALDDRETPVLKKRLFLSLGFLVVLMYFSACRNMLGAPLPAVLENSPFAVGCVQAVLAAAVMCINKKFFISGFKGVIHKAPNMDTLVALGSFVSFAWSICQLALIAKVAENDFTEAEELLHGLYFESAAMILVLITVGKLLEAKSKGKTTSALKSLMRLAPKTAVLIKDGAEMTVNIEEIRPGDIFAVKPGESVPVDGVVTEGGCAVDESALTGESIPVDKIPGDEVCAATVNKSGYIRCRATRVGSDTALAKIIKTVSDAAATKAPIAKTADKVSGIFVPAVIIIAVLTLAGWLISGKPFDFALARAVSVLVISCPCALGLATPVAVTVGSGSGAKHGILFKTAAALEQTGKVQIVALDKTGTVTNGKPEAVEIIPADGITETELLEAAYSVEYKSEHPLAEAIVRKAQSMNITPCETRDFKALPGYGVRAFCNNEIITGGSVSFIDSKIRLDAETKNICSKLCDKGCTPLLFAKGEKYIGTVAVADTLKPDSKKAIAELKNAGIRVVMLTGDNNRTAKAIAEKAGIDCTVAGVLPEGKQTVIEKLKSLGTVAMAGDGINDAPALASADTGIAFGSGTDIAAESADTVLINSDLCDLPAAIRLSRAVLKNIRENLFWAFFYNMICIPLAAGLFSGLGLVLNPMIGAAAMSLSSFCVVSNALRLNLVDIHSDKKDKKIKNPVSEDAFTALVDEINKTAEVKVMKKTLIIEGMMCPHCEAHTKKALEALDGVESASASHTDGKAVVTLSKDVDNASLKAAVEDAGYTVTGIE